MKPIICAAAALMLLATFSTAQEVPVGTLLPVQLSKSLKAGKVKAGDRLSARLAQYLVLNDVRLPRGTQVSGHVIESQPGSPGSPARLAVRFDTLRIQGRDVPISTSLRALASMQEVFEAQLPTNAIDDYGTTIFDWNTLQVGGQVVYRGDGVVMEGQNVVAKASSVGEVFGEPKTWPWSACLRDRASKTVQSFWVFSTDACGVYGFDSLKLAHAGRTDPVGQITLESHDKLELHAGSGWLLMVLSSGESTNSTRGDSHLTAESGSIGSENQP